ncbi:hypothetical protein ACOMHN_021677 [Nucella lapillus]
MRSSGCCVAGHLTMEVPLTWQDPLALTHFSAMENDLEDVPPSPTLDPLPLPAPLGVAGAGFQRGFLDCAQEALRFLTEEEGMSQDNPVVMGLRQHLVQATPPHITPPTPSPCLTSTVSQRARFAPYTVPSHHRSLSAGYPRRELSKHGVCSSSITLSGQNASSLHRCTAPSAAPSVEKLGHVLTSDLISADDLQGVLRCLGSGPSQLQTTSSVSSSLSTLSSSSSIVHHQQTSNVKGGCVVVEGERKSDGWQRKSSSLDDSGISEMSVELDDEVDGEGRRCTSVSESVCGLDTPTSADSGCVSVLDSPGLALTPDNGVGDSVGRCSASRFSFENLPTDTYTHSPDNPPISAASPCTTDPSPITTDAPVHSNPSSQLALLSSLSSGTHRLTSPAAAEDNNSGDATAGRIQSLASQILLLLQEEADALDYSDDDDDYDEDDDDHQDQLDSELGEFDVEGDSWNLEAEP